MVLAGACAPAGGASREGRQVVGGPVDGLTATIEDNSRELAGDRVAWSTTWTLCWAAYPDAMAYELQARTAEGTLPRLDRQEDRCFRLEAAGGEHARAEWRARRDLLLALSTGQLAYRVRAVLPGNRVSEWSPAVAVGEALHDPATGHVANGRSVRLANASWSQRWTRYRV
jgi:hypothetical protein